MRKGRPSRGVSASFSPRYGGGWVLAARGAVAGMPTSALSRTRSQLPVVPMAPLPRNGAREPESSIDGLFQCAPNCGHVDNCIGHIGESCRIRRAAVRRDGRDAAMDSVGGSRRVRHPSRPTWAHLLPSLNWMKVTDSMRFMGASTLGGWGCDWKRLGVT